MLMCDAWCMCAVYYCLPLMVLNVYLLCLFTTLENEEGGVAEETYYHSCLFQEESQDQYHGKTSQCLLLLHLSLSIMHVFISEVLQKMFKQNYFLCGYYYYSYYINYHTASS